MYYAHNPLHHHDRFITWNEKVWMLNAALLPQALKQIFLRTWHDKMTLQVSGKQGQSRNSLKGGKSNMPGIAPFPVEPCPFETGRLRGLRYWNWSLKLLHTQHFTSLGPQQHTLQVWGWSDEQFSRTSKDRHTYVHTETPSIIARLSFFPFC